MRPGICTMFALVLWAAGPSRSVLAEGPKAPEALGDKALSAEEAARRGDMARRAGRWQEAEAAYRAAWEASGRAAWAGELGLCELAQQKHRDAAAHLRRALDGAEALSPGARARFEQGLGQARKHLATAALAVNPAEAEVFLDGRRLGQGQPGYMVDVEPGTHEARAVLKGYREGVWRFEAQRGDRPMVPITLDPLPAQSPPPASAQAPAMRTSPPTPPPAPLAMDHGRVVRIGGIALAATGVVLGVSFGIAAVVNDDEAASQREAIRADGARRAACSGYTDYAQRCTALEDALSARDTMKAAAWTSVAVGAAFGAVALSSMWWAPSPERREVRVAPAVSAHGGGLVAVGVW